MIITKRALPRRTVLRGLGVTVALPFLDAMVPALSAAPKMPRRLAFFYFGNGVAVRDWMPTGEGRNFEYGRTMKEAVEPFRSKTLVVTGLFNRAGQSITDGGGVHTRVQAAWLSGVLAAPTETTPRLGKTADQYAADLWGPETALPSLELALDSTQGGKGCDAGYACVYKNLSWSGPTSPLPVETSPRQLFERLFGDGGTPEQRRAQIRRRASLLDVLMEDVRRLERQLGAGDRAQLHKQLEDVRVVEERIQRAEARATEMPVPFERPLSVPDSYKEYSDLMYDLLAAAFQADLTRVATFLASMELSSLVFRDIGLVDQIHNISHHGQKEEVLEHYQKANVFQLSHWTRFLGKLQNMPEGDGSVLDHSLLMYGSGIGDGDAHDSANVPVVIAGGAPLSGGRVVQYDPNQRIALSNLMVSLLELSGVPLDRLGDSDGKLAEVVAPLSL